MHTTNIDNTTFHYNSDGSGMVTVEHRPISGVEGAVNIIEVPFDTLIEFVGQFIQQVEISHIEGCSGLVYLMDKGRD